MVARTSYNNCCKPTAIIRRHHPGGQDRPLSTNRMLTKLSLAPMMTDQDHLDLI